MITACSQERIAFMQAVNVTRLMQVCNKLHQARWLHVGQFALSLLITCRLVIIKPQQAMRTHPYCKATKALQLPFLSV